VLVGDKAAIGFEDRAVKQRPGQDLQNSVRSIPDFRVRATVSPILSMMDVIRKLPLSLMRLALREFSSMTKVFCSHGLAMADVGRPFGAIVDCEAMAGFEQTAQHRAAQVAETDEPDVHDNCLRMRAGAAKRGQFHIEDPT
jgi:hypothetical protein